MNWDVVVPALTLKGRGGTPDMTATREYARRAASTWIDLFIISGSTTNGEQATATQRAAVLDLWLDVAPAERLLACCWEPEDLGQAAARAIPPMVTLRGLDRDAALGLLGRLPPGSYVYSHPMFGGVQFDDRLAEAARVEGHLPTGGKLAKATLDDISRVRGATGVGFRLWDGSSRRIAASLAAGASGVVAAALSAFDVDLPPRALSAVQPAVDRLQAQLDTLPSRSARTAELERRAATA